MCSKLECSKDIQYTLQKYIIIALPENIIILYTKFPISG